jgi:hypothetical protein
LTSFARDFDRIQFFVEQDLFSNTKYKSLDFFGAKRVGVIVDDDQVLPGHIMQLGHGKAWIVDYGDGIVAPAYVKGVSALKRQLAGLVLKPKDIAIFDTTDDPGIQAEVGESDLDKNRFRFGPFERGGLGKFLYRRPTFVLALVESSERNRNGVQSASERNLTKIKAFTLEHGIPLGVWKDPTFVTGSKLASRLAPLQQTTPITGLEFLQKLVAKQNPIDGVFITEVGQENSGGPIKGATLSNLAEMSTDPPVAEAYEITFPQQMSSTPKDRSSNLKLRLTLLVMAIVVSLAICAYVIRRFGYRRKEASLSNLASQDAKRGER